MPMPIDMSCPIRCVDETIEPKIDGLAAETVLILALSRKGTICPLGTSKFKVRPITESELQQLGAKLQGFPDHIMISHVEGAEGCMVVSGNGGAVYIPC